MSMNRALPPVLFALLSLSVVSCQQFEKLESGDATVSEDEVFAAGKTDDPELTDDLWNVLDRRSEYPTEVVVAALGALAERGDPASVPHIAGLSNDENEEVRWHVAVALKRIGGEGARDVLLRMAANDESELVRSEAGSH